jgi:hypothetical protein
LTLPAVSSRLVGLPMILKSLGSFSVTFSGTGSLLAGAASWP